MSTNNLSLVTPVEVEVPILLSDGVPEAPIDGRVYGRGGNTEEGRGYQWIPLDGNKTLVGLSEVDNVSVQDIINTSLTVDDGNPEKETVSDAIRNRVKFFNGPNQFSVGNADIFGEYLRGLNGRCLRSDIALDINANFTTSSYGIGCTSTQDLTTGKTCELVINLNGHTVTLPPTTFYINVPKITINGGLANQNGGISGRIVLSSGTTCTVNNVTLGDVVVQPGATLDIGGGSGNVGVSNNQGTVRIFQGYGGIVGTSNDTPVPGDGIVIDNRAWIGDAYKGPQDTYSRRSIGEPLEHDNQTYGRRSNNDGTEEWISTYTKAEANSILQNKDDHTVPNRIPWKENIIGSSAYPPGQGNTRVWTGNGAAPTDAETGHTGDWYHLQTLDIGSGLYPDNPDELPVPESVDEELNQKVDKASFNGGIVPPTPPTDPEDAAHYNGSYEYWVSDGEDYDYEDEPTGKQNGHWMQVTKAGLGLANVKDYSPAGLTGSGLDNGNSPANAVYNPLVPASRTGTTNTTTSVQTALDSTYQQLEYEVQGVGSTAKPLVGKENRIPQGAQPQAASQQYWRATGNPIRYDDTGNTGAWHTLVKADIGLGNVDNLSADTIINTTNTLGGDSSTTHTTTVSAQVQSKENRIASPGAYTQGPETYKVYVAKADGSNPSGFDSGNSGEWHQLVRADVGLSNVDNTSDDALVNTVLTLGGTSSTTRTRTIAAAVDSIDSKNDDQDKRLDDLEETTSDLADDKEDKDTFQTGQDAARVWVGAAAKAAQGTPDEAGYQPAIAASSNASGQWHLLTQADLGLSHVEDYSVTDALNTLARVQDPTLAAGTLNPVSTIVANLNEKTNQVKAIADANTAGKLDKPTASDWDPTAVLAVSPNAQYVQLSGVYESYAATVIEEAIYNWDAANKRLTIAQDFYDTHDIFYIPSPDDYHGTVLALNKAMLPDTGDPETNYVDLSYPYSPPDFVWPTTDNAIAVTDIVFARFYAADPQNSGLPTLRYTMAAFPPTATKEITYNTGTDARVGIVKIGKNIQTGATGDNPNEGLIWVNVAQGLDAKPSTEAAGEPYRGVASFGNNGFLVRDGHVELEPAGTDSNNIGGVYVAGATDNINLDSSGRITVNTATDTGASTPLKGVALFNKDHFTVNSGTVDLDAATLSTSRSGAGTRGGVVIGDNIGLSGDTISVATATTTVIGLASFNTDNFTVSNGAVTLKAGTSSTLGGITVASQTADQPLGLSAAGDLSIQDADTTNKGVAKFNSDNFSVASGNVTLKAATASTLGGVKIGDNIDNTDGTLSVKIANSTDENTLGIASFDTDNFNVTDGHVALNAANASTLGGITVAAQSETQPLGLSAAGDLSIQVASSNNLGVVKTGTNINNSSGTISVATASGTNLGVVKQGTAVDDVSIPVTVANDGGLTLPLAQGSETFGAVKAGSNITITNGVVSLNYTPAPPSVAGAGSTDTATTKGYAGFDSQSFAATTDGWVTLKAATSTTTGGVRAGAASTTLGGVSVDGTGVMSVPAATSTNMGVVKAGTNISNSSGTLSVSTASGTTLGLCAQGTNVTVSSAGLISVATANGTTLGLCKQGGDSTTAVAVRVDSAGAMTVPVMTASQLGVAKVGSGLAITDGVLSATAQTPSNIGNGTTSSLGTLGVAAIKDPQVSGLKAGGTSGELRVGIAILSHNQVSVAASATTGSWSVTHNCQDNTPANHEFLISIASTDTAGSGTSITDDAYLNAQNMNIRITGYTVTATAATVNYKVLGTASPTTAYFYLTHIHKNVNLSF